jgi:oxalate---CoA ligase
MTDSFIDSQDRLHSEMLRIWSRLLESSDLSIDDDFFDKGGDSLLATELMLELRQLTGSPLPDSLLFESSTIRSLAQRLSEKEPPRAKAAVRIGAASDCAAPLLFFHGDWTWGGFYVEHLARKLAPEFSVIAVAPHGPGASRFRLRSKPWRPIDCRQFWRPSQRVPTDWPGTVLGGLWRSRRPGC